MKTNYGELIVEKSQEFVVEITLNRPKSLNTFSSTMAAELYEALVAADGAPDVRVVVLQGAGKAFCAGIDVNELAGKTAMDYREWIERMERPLLTVSKMKKPVLAKVQGVAAANGMGLLAAADLVVAAENTRMGLTAINVGLNCVGPVIPVARCVGRKKALELLFFGNLIPAREALALGLVNTVVPPEDLDGEKDRWAKELARRSPIALQIAKRAFYQAEDMAYDKQFAYMNEAFARLCTTEDAREGVRAFFEKRVPAWTGK